MDWVWKLVPSLGSVAAVVLVLFVARRILERGDARAEDLRFRNQLVTAALSLLGLVIIVIALPVSESLRGQLLALIGILLSAAIALAATTFLGNALAGIMLRGAIRNFGMGDFIQCGEHLGRVSERGLFHTEIQTEGRDLITLPNFYLVSHPVTTVQPSGTIVECTVSLGYDVPRVEIEETLLRAAEKAALEGPFVRILELGDFSVTYRIAGLLKDVKHVLATTSLLKGEVMDALHANDVEIVSPTFRNTRALSPERRFIPERPRATPPDASRDSKTEAVVFDKADAAESLEAMRERVKGIEEELAALKEKAKKADRDSEREELAAAAAALEARKEALAASIARREEQNRKNEGT
jgi:small-conductance mechanosensitive channel